MNKKLRKAKKDIKRKLNSIEFKRSCKNLKKQFLQEFKTAMVDNSYYLEIAIPTNYRKNFPIIKEQDENSRTILPLDISKAINYILWLLKYHEKVKITCYSFQKDEETTIII